VDENAGIVDERSEGEISLWLESWRFLTSFEMTRLYRQDAAACTCLIWLRTGIMPPGRTPCAPTRIPGWCLV